MAATKVLLKKDFHGFSIYGKLTNGRKYGVPRLLIEIKQEGSPSYQLYECLGFKHGAKLHFEKKP